MVTVLDAFYDQPKVNKFNHVVLADAVVVWLHILVNEARTMELLECTEHLNKHLACAQLPWEWRELEVFFDGVLDMLHNQDFFMTVVALKVYIFRNVFHLKVTMQGP